MKFEAGNTGKDSNWVYPGSDVSILDKLNNIEEWIRSPFPTNIPKIINGLQVWRGFQKIQIGIYRIFKHTISAPHLEEIKLLHFFWFLKNTETAKENIEAIKASSRKVLQSNVRHYLNIKEDLIKAIDDIQWL